jgi:hypothetical protein
VVIGLPADTATGNGFPFSCLEGDYWQIYNAGAFSGPLTITGLMFYNTQLDAHVSALDGGNWTIELSTTPSIDWDSISVGNHSPGADVDTVFSGDLGQPWAFGDTLSITFGTPFPYDPANGNLLMHVSASGLSSSNGVVFDTNGFNGGSFDGNSIMGIAESGTMLGPGGGPLASATNGFGLVTGFVTPTPEPAALVLLAPALGCLAVLRRRFPHPL